MTDINIQLAPEVIWQWGPVPITSAVLASFLITAMMLVMGLVLRRRLSLVPGRFQLSMELAFTFFLDRLESMFGSKKEARQFLPLIFTIFVFLVLSNQFSLLPLVESVVTEDGVNLLRAPSSHYSMTIAWTLLVLLLANGFAFWISPLRYLGNFFRFRAFASMKSIKDLPLAFLEFYLGLMDIIGEAAKVISLSTRLFGNILAGQIIFVVISGLAVLTGFVLPIPFVALSVFAGFVQAFVFAILSAVYISSALAGVKSS